MPRVTVGEENGAPIELYYEDHGDGQPVVLIHGWPLSGRAWEKQVPALVDGGYRVITYDRRGFGQSSQPWDGYDYDTFAADLHALLEHLDLVQDVTLVGFSMGGGEVARYVGMYGTERLSKVVFAAAVPPYLLKTSDNPDGGVDEATVAGLRAGVEGDRIEFLQGFFDGFFAAGEHDDLISDAQLNYQLSIAAIASPKGTTDCIEAFSTTDFREDLEQIDVPCLVIHGDSDGIVPIEASGQRTADTVTNAELVVVPDAPHGLILTHAGIFNGELLAFLDDDD